MASKNNMKVCFDTCVLIDFFGKTDNFEKTLIAIDVAIVNGFETCCTASSTTDIVYLMHSRGFRSTNAEARANIEKLFNLFTIISNSEADVKMAYSSKMTDYEDALIAYSANRANVNFIITNNEKDFKFSPVPTLTPAEFIKLYTPADYSYEEFLV